MFETESLETDYDLHGCCVSVCRSKNPLSRLINKTIHQNYAQFVKAIRNVEDDDAIRQLWSSLNRNDLRQLSGYYWAILCSTKISDEVKYDVYGEVHMISHICGQRNKTEQLEQDNQIDQLKLDLQKKSHSIRRKQVQIDQLRRVNEELKIRICEVVRSKSSVESKPSSENKSVLAHEQIINSQLRGMDQLQSRIDKYELRIDSLENQLKYSEQRKPDSRDNTAEAKQSADANSTITPSDLAGKKILYVGGFARHRNKFQKLTENMNGCFLYHDGGVQQSVYQLDELVKRADAIFCPVDCISHGAVDRIKTLSRTECKDCVFLRSASLSSFKNKVSQYAASR